MPDLDAAIRARLASWAPVPRPDGYPGPEFTATTDEHLSPEQRELWRARWELLMGEPPSGAVHILYSGFFHPGCDQMRAAILAALDLHRPRTAIESDVAGQQVCDECSDGTDDFLAKLWPCPTLLAIAKALGIEVD